MVVHVDVGGEGRYAGAWNVNPFGLTSTTGTPGRPIPNLVVARGEALPFGDAVADLVTVEHAPIRSETAAEIARVLKPGGTVRLLHPGDYAAATHDAVAGALGVRLAERSTTLLPEGDALTLLRAVAHLAR